MHHERGFPRPSTPPKEASSPKTRLWPISELLTTHAELFDAIWTSYCQREVFQAVDAYGLKPRLIVSHRGISWGTSR